MTYAPWLAVDMGQVPMLHGSQKAVKQSFYKAAKSEVDINFEKITYD